MPVLKVRHKPGLRHILKSILNPVFSLSGWKSRTEWTNRFLFFQWKNLILREKSVCLKIKNKCQFIAPHSDLNSSDQRYKITGSPLCNMIFFAINQPFVPVFSCWALQNTRPNFSQMAKLWPLLAQKSVSGVRGTLWFYSVGRYHLNHCAIVECLSMLKHARAFTQPQWTCPWTIFSPMDGHGRIYGRINASKNSC